MRSTCVQAQKMSPNGQQEELQTVGQERLVVHKHPWSILMQLSHHSSATKADNILISSLNVTMLATSLPVLSAKFTHEL